MPHVFISYAWRDGADLADWLYERFNALKGWSAWMDRDLHADTVFSHELQKRIDDADLIVVVVSPDVNRRDPPSFVQRELIYATQEAVNKPVFAARVAKCQIPLIIAGVTFDDFFPDGRHGAAFESLVHHVEQSLQGRTAAAPYTRRERELAYLRDIARQHGFWGKVYVDTPAEARVRRKTDPDAEVDPEVAAYLSEIVMSIYAEKRHCADDEAAAGKVESFQALTGALARFERVAIIGDPGSGKTTTLRRFAYDLGEKAALDETAPLPVFVPLGGYDGGDLAAYIEAHFGGLTLRDYLPDRVVALLDGLNETAHENVAAVQDWLNANPKVRVMLTCRKLDYVERKLDLQRVDVLPLDIPRIRRFMIAYSLRSCDPLFWGLAGDDLRAIWDIWQREGKTFEGFWLGDDIASATLRSQNNYLRQVRAAMRERDAYPGLLGLVRNPFLLTIAIAVFRDSGEVPRNRAQLFAGFVKKLFEDRGRPAARINPPWIDEETQRRALSRLAYRMQAEQKGTRVPYPWARDAAAEAAPGQDPDHLLYLAASAGIVEKGDEVRFTHQLLQEYFAAHEMAEDLRRSVPASKYWPGEQWWEATGWEETALLLAGMTGDAADVVRWLTSVQPILAYRCAMESGAPCNESTLQSLYDPPAGARVAPLARAAWGRALAERGDTRPGVGLRYSSPLPPRSLPACGEGAGGVPDIVWCEVPGGPFLMGSDKDKDSQAYNDETPQHEVTLSTFYVAKYPITYAQFQAFLDDPGGFANDEWWAGLAKRETEPGEQRFKYANHPRENVSWYDAMAFCRWLNARVPLSHPGERGSGGEGWQIRLPTEAEWEKAARGPKGLIYPYGNTFDPTQGNTSESGIGQTSAVGLFALGASPYGALDMSGNVWQWCATKWLKSYYEAEDNDPAGDAWRCLRCGSWLNPEDIARAADRYGYDPVVRSYAIGFRVVYVAPISESLIPGRRVAPKDAEGVPLAFPREARSKNFNFWPFHRRR